MDMRGLPESSVGSNVSGAVERTAPETNSAIDECAEWNERRSMAPLRIGILGASRIAESAIVKPARDLGHRLVAVAARDHGRAESFAIASGSSVSWTRTTM